MNLKDLQLAEIPPQKPQSYRKVHTIRKNGCNQYQILVGYSIIECEHCDHLDSEKIAKNITVNDLDKQSFIYDFKTSKVISLSRLNGISSIDVLYSDQNNSKDLTAEHVDGSFLNSLKFIFFCVNCSWKLFQTKQWAFQKMMHVSSLTVVVTTISRPLELCHTMRRKEMQKKWKSIANVRSSNHLIKKWQLKL